MVASTFLFRNDAEIDIWNESAMGNAIAEVKAAADAVTNTNDEDGVSSYLDCSC